MFGPDPHSFDLKEPRWSLESRQYFAEFIVDTKKNVKGYTYHEYIGVMSDADALNPAFLDESRKNAEKVLSVMEVCISFPKRLAALRFRL